MSGADTTKAGVRVIICGGRDFNDMKYFNEIMDLFHQNYPVYEVIHGKAKGADTLAGIWAREKGIKETPVPADWEAYGKRAGYLRNCKMADLGPDLVIAFPGGKGTMMMKGIALARNIEVINHFEII